jgi:hypothetical protein
LSLRRTSKQYIQTGIAELSAQTREAVDDIVQRLHEADPAKQQFTFKEIVQALEPMPEKVMQACRALGLEVRELLWNVVIQLGRDGNLAVDVVPDNRGYAHLVVRF